MLLPSERIPRDPTGTWSCETFTVGGQIVGLRKFEVLTAAGTSVDDAAAGGSGSGSGSGSGRSGSAGSATTGDD